MEKPTKASPQSWPGMGRLLMNGGASAQGFHVVQGLTAVVNLFRHGNVICGSTAADNLLMQLSVHAVSLGQWMNNQRHGQGRMQYSNGDAYEGLWIKDHRNGLAKYFYANGDVFVGRYEQNRREGLGTIYMVTNAVPLSHAAA